MTSTELRLRARVLLHKDLPDPDQRRALRKGAGLTQCDLAEACGVTPQAVSHWENGTRTPKGKCLEKYVTALRTLRDVA